MRSRRFWIIAAAMWFTFGLLTGLQVWISMITHGHTVPLLVGYYVLIWFAWFGITVVIDLLSRRWPILPPTRLNLAIHGLAACLIAIVHITFWLGAMIVMQPFDRMTAATEQLRIPPILISRFPLEIILYILVLAAVQAIDYYQKYRDAAGALTAARLHALELQLQPHFLFNTLNSVSALVRVGKSEQAVKMIAMLSDLLRYALDHSGVQRVTLDEEMTTLRRYFDIQRMRFSDRLELDIEVADDVKNVRVPTFILQPLAENAVRHGIARSASEGRVHVRAFRENGFVNIEMFNTGSLDEAHAPGVGLRNTTERLQQMYGSSHRFVLRPAPGGGVLAALSIPWENG